MGLYAEIYDGSAGRDPCSVWPMSARRVFVVNAEGPFERRSDEPAVLIVPAAGRQNIIRAVPVDARGYLIPGVMKGYSYIASSDSRFGEACQQIAGVPFYGAVALHDRLEG